MSAKTPRPAPPQPLASATAALNAWIEVDLDALGANLQALRSVIGAAEIFAVVKANAYGHGAALAAPALESAGVERFAVVSMGEAIALRAAGVTRPVLILGHSFPADAAAAVEHDLALTVDSRALAEALASAAAEAPGGTARAHVKVDTGLHRFGVAPAEALRLVERIRALPGVTLEGFWTHVANADERDDTFSAAQAATFEAALALLGPVPLRHAANTATALRRPELRYDAVRLGLGLYGILPDNTPGPRLTPSLCLKARLARVSDIARGEGVSYGLTWRAQRRSRIALVPVGYADGWPRSLGNRGQVLVGGKRCAIVGRVCMDHFVVDVTDVPAAAAGDEAVLIGTQRDNDISVNEVAIAAETISWDILASLGTRLPRLAHRAGLLQGTG